MLWLNYFLVGFFLRDDDNNLHNFIPADANISLRVNNDVLVRRMLYDLFYQSHFSDEELQVLSMKGEASNLPALGIDATKEIILFYENWNDKSIIGWLFHISSSTDFEKYIFGSPSVIKSHIGKLGCVLILSSEPSSEETSKFVHYANDLLIDTKDLSASKRFFSKSPKNEIIQLFFEGKKDGFLQKTGVNIFFQNEKLLIKGTGKKNPLLDYTLDSLHYIDKSIGDNYLEIKAGALPDTIQKYIDYLLESSGFELPEITSQHIMMYGVEIDNLKGSIAVLPKIDAIFRFERPFSVASIMDKVVSIDNNLKSDGVSYFSIGTVKYYVQQISSTEIYIGINESPNIVYQIDRNFFKISGNLTSIFTIEGTGLIAQIAQLMPEVQNSKKFFSSMEHFDIHAYIVEDDNIVIDGVMLFPTDKVASLEFLNYLIRF